MDSNVSYTTSFSEEDNTTLLELANKNKMTPEEYIESKALKTIRVSRRDKKYLTYISDANAQLKELDTAVKSLNPPPYFIMALHNLEEVFKKMSCVH